MSDTNPLFDAIALNTDHGSKAREARAEHSLIMESIADRENTDTTSLSGDYYFDPTIMGFQNFDWDKEFQEAEDADWNLSVKDMPVGFTGAKNRKRPFDIARASYGVSTAIDSVSNRQLLDNIAVRVNDESVSGWEQFKHSAMGINPFADVTGDTGRLLDELRSALGENQLKDDDGNPIEFTPEAYLAAVTEHNPEVAIALRRYNITAESLAGIDNFATATEELGGVVMQVEGKPAAHRF